MSIFSSHLLDKRECVGSHHVELAPNLISSGSAYEVEVKTKVYFLCIILVEARLHLD